MKLAFKSRHLVSASLAIALIAAPFALVQACGPDFQPDVFVRKNMPDDLQAFNRGHLGILQSGYDSDQYAVAYRYLSGGKLSPEELEADITPQPGQNGSGNGWPTTFPTQATSEWLALRAKFTTEPPATQRDKSNSPVPSGNVVIGGDYLNCPDPAIHNALATLDKRAATWGAKSPFLIDWIHGQDAVLSNCASHDFLSPTPAPANSPALLRADRAYQIAAANFYGQEYDQAAQQFAAIALDKSSPWATWGGYLAARATVRKAFASAKPTDPYSGELASFDLPTMQTAQKMLESLLAQRNPQPSRKILQHELNFVRIRTEPEKRVTEICAALAGPEPDPNFALDRADLNFALVKQIPINDPPPLLAWIQSFRNIAKPGSELALWQKTRSLPWLVLSLVHATPSDPATPALLADADKIQPTSPAYQTLFFHRMRLRIPSQPDQARDLLDQALNNKSALPPGSDRNALLSERMALARSFPELLTFAPRTDLVQQSSGEAARYEQCARQPQNQGNPSECLTPPVNQEFDLDAVDILNLHTPLSLLVEAATSPRLPPNLREEVTLAAWTRSVLLEDQINAQKLVPLLPKPLRQSAKIDANTTTGFPAIVAILRNPGLRPFVETGISRLASYNTLDDYRDNWWANNWLGENAINSPYLSSEEQAALHAPAYQLKALPGLTNEQKQAALTEHDRLVKFPIGPALLGRRVLDYAKDHPDDPTVPEALHLTVRATRYGQSRNDDAKDTETSAVSKAAFQLLHTRYPKSPWTDKTPYYF